MSWLGFLKIVWGKLADGFGSGAIIKTKFEAESFQNAGSE